MHAPHGARRAPVPGDLRRRDRGRDLPAHRPGRVRALCCRPAPLELPLTVEQEMDGADASEADTAARYRDGLQRWLPTGIAGVIEGARSVVIENLEPISSVGGARRPWQFDVR